MGIHDRGSTYIPDLCNITWHATWRGYTGDYGKVWSECNAIPNPYINLILLRWHIIFTFHCADTRLCVDVRLGCMPTLQATFAFSCSYTDSYLSISQVSPYILSLLNFQNRLHPWLVFIIHRYKFIIPGWISPHVSVFNPSRSRTIGLPLSIS
jgi:hypothetical protein